MKKLIRAFGLMLGLPALILASSPPAGNYIINISTNAAVQAFDVSSGTVTGQLTVGSCALSGGGSCGGGGSGPSGQIISGSQGGIAQYSVAGTSNVVSAISSTTFILNQVVLQPNSTFYVTSGTIAGPLNVTGQTTMNGQTNAASVDMDNAVGNRYWNSSMNAGAYVYNAGASGKNVLNIQNAQDACFGVACNSAGGFGVIGSTLSFSSGAFTNALTVAGQTLCETNGTNCPAGVAGTGTINVGNQYSALYYSVAGSSNVASAVAPVAGNYVFTSSGTAGPPYWAPASASTPPGGTGTQIQYKNGSSFGGVPGSTVTATGPIIDSMTVTTQQQWGTGANAYTATIGYEQMQFTAGTNNVFAFQQNTTPMLTIAPNQVLYYPPLSLSEISAPSGSSGQDWIWGDSSAHWPKMINNNSSAYGVLGSSTSNTSGHFGVWSGAYSQSDYDLWGASPTARGQWNFTSAQPSTFTALAVTTALTVSGQNVCQANGTNCPVAGGDVYKASTQTFTGQNTFLNQVTISSSIAMTGSGNATITEPNGVSGQVVLSTAGASVTAGHCAQFGSSMTVVDAGAACGTGSGGTITGVTAGPGLTGGGLSGTVTVSVSSVSLSSQTIGTLPIANGGTGATSAAIVAGAAIGVSGTFPNQTVSVSSVSLSSQVVGNLPVTNLNSGTNADSSHFWRGDGTWVSTATFGGGASLSSTNTWTAQQTFNNTIIVSSTIALGSAGTVGTSGQVLTSSGPTHAPVWATASSGGCTILSATGDYFMPGIGFAYSAYPESGNDQYALSAGGANDQLASMVYIPCSFTPNSLSIVIPTGGAGSGTCKSSVGIYNESGTLVIYSGVFTNATTVACNTTGVKTFTSATNPAATGLGTSYPAGFYYISTTSNETTGLIRAAPTTDVTLINAVHTVFGFSYGTTSNGALPGTLPSLTTNANFLPEVNLSY